MATNNKFIRKLRRELTSNPKKSALLGLLFVVAIWFWAPLIMKWCGKNSDETAKAAGVSSTATAAGGASGSGVSAGTTEASSGAVAANSKLATPNWHQVLGWITSDPMMQPHVPQASSRDPFTSASSRIAAQKKAQHPVEPPAPELTPAEAGISLHSTVVSPRMKTALINSRAYHENQTVTSADGQARFVLVEIREDGVTLSRHGHSYELKLRKVEVAKVDQ